MGVSMSQAECLIEKQWRFYSDEFDRWVISLRAKAIRIASWENE